MTLSTGSSPEAPGLVTGGHGFCSACGAQRVRAARYCPSCGALVRGGANSPYSAPFRARARATSPWTVAWLTLLVLVARFAARPTDLPSPDAGVSDGLDLPNITTMSPSERADRLYIRMANYDERGQADSLRFFAPMAMAAHQLLANPTLDERFHYGRIADMMGDTAVASAQARSMLAERPTSLLGLTLAASTARRAGDSAGAREFGQRLLAALATERTERPADYDQHRLEVDREAARARAPN